MNNNINVTLKTAKKKKNDTDTMKTARWGLPPQKQTIAILEFDDMFFLVLNSIVSEQDMADYAQHKS